MLESNARMVCTLVQPFEMFMQHETVGKLVVNLEDRMAAGSWLPVIIRIYVVDIRI